MVLVCGSMRAHDLDWAGLVTAVHGERAVTVKPLEVESTSENENENENENDAARRSNETTVTLRLARGYPMKRVDRSAVMERLTFARDGVGMVLDAKDDAPPMLGGRFRVEMSSAERAMVRGESPERFREARGERCDVENEADFVDDVGNVVSESVYSLFEVKRDRDSDTESTADAFGTPPSLDLGEDTPSTRARSDVQEGAGDSISPGSLVCRHVPGADDVVAEEASASQASDRASDDVREIRAVASSPGQHEWKGAISYLREQLTTQRGVRLILRRDDVERLLDEIER